MKYFSNAIFITSNETKIFTFYLVYFSYFKILIQEMDVKVDKGFLMALIDLFTNKERRGKEVIQKIF